MSKASTYIASVIFSLLLIFLMIGAALAGVLRYCALDTETALSIVDSQNLPARVHAALETNAKQQESTTGIPYDVYAEAITEEQLAPIIRDTVTNGFAYLRGDTASLGIQPDFSALEAKIREFFISYAEKNGIKQNETFEEAVRSTTDAAEANILAACDVFRFGSLNDAGVIKKAKVYVPWAGIAALALIAAVIIFACILFLINVHEHGNGFYWIGTASLIAAILLLIPSVWLYQARWFDRFAVKTDQTFAAVTGFLYTNTKAVILTAIGGIIAAIFMYLIFGLFRLRRHKREVVRKAKH
ncbi:MAG: hypothetical protein IK134_04040 [Oscillospiraceae bacterium]|nr:hypothetical protein [Oscillospiraceae bacterium]